MKDKMAIWVWFCDAPHGGYLFHGNPHPLQNLPPYHLGDIENMIYGERIVCQQTRRVLEMDADIIWWNNRFPQFKVKPKNIMVYTKTIYRQQAKGKDKK